MSGSPEDVRESSIVALAKRFLELPAPLEQPSPEELRRVFMAVAGYRALAEAETPTHAELDLSRVDEHVLGLKIWVRDRGELNRLRSSVNLTLIPRVEADVVAYHFGGQSGAPSDGTEDPWGVAARVAFRVPGKKGSREQRLDPGAVVTALAILYLSKSGGGRRTIGSATKLLQAEIDLLGPADDGSVHPYVDSRARRRVLATLKDRCGPLS